MLLCLAPGGVSVFLRLGPLPDAAVAGATGLTSCALGRHFRGPETKVGGASRRGWGVARSKCGQSLKVKVA